jgi:hypothetical protein
VEDYPSPPDIYQYGGGTQIDPYVFRETEHYEILLWSDYFGSNDYISTNPSQIL